MEGGGPLLLVVTKDTYQSFACWQEECLSAARLANHLPHYIHSSEVSIGSLPDSARVGKTFGTRPSLSALLQEGGTDFTTLCRNFASDVGEWSSRRGEWSSHRGEWSSHRGEWSSRRGAVLREKPGNGPLAGSVYATQKQ
jgi:hypothetical protein